MRAIRRSSSLSSSLGYLACSSSPESLDEALTRRRLAAGTPTTAAWSRGTRRCEETLTVWPRLLMLLLLLEVVVGLLPGLH